MTELRCLNVIVTVLSKYVFLGPDVTLCVFQDFQPGDVRTFAAFVSEPGRHSLPEDRYVSKTLA